MKYNYPKIYKSLNSSVAKSSSQLTVAQQLIGERHKIERISKYTGKYVNVLEFFDMALVALSVIRRSITQLYHSYQ